jgi:short-subunit dehydrogenase
MKYLIIGASSGLGKELAKKFAEENNDLVIVSRDERDLNAIKSDLETKHKIKVDVLPLDFSSINEIEDKLLSNNNLISNLTGALFPIGMMFDNDNLNLSVENISKLTNANFISIAYTIQKIKKILIQKENACIIGFGSVSGFLGRDINVTYAGAKRGLESYFESMAFDEEFEKINIQFYTLGYLATNLSFGKDLKLPKGSVKKLSNIVFNNRIAKFKKTYYPAYWMIIHLILKIIPFSILRILKIK